jgi:hypothetical protein
VRLARLRDEAWDENVLRALGRGVFRTRVPVNEEDEKDEMTEAFLDRSEREGC